MHEMEKEEKEIFIMVTLEDSSSDKETTKRGRKRQRLRHQFSFRGFGENCEACKSKWYNPRFHRNTGKKPSKSSTFEDIQKVSQFIANYAEEFGIPQSAAPRGRDNVPPIYLPCDTTKIFVHSKYLSSCEELQTLCVSIPHNARQMEPVYFITTRKVQIFGFRIDGIPKQLNFFLDEHETVGKDCTQTSGPNAVISMID
ncbi:hypothetical protein KUTeg_021389 [Tegillarca granosa]|uniref:Uncharacterized protein n=1 Tax=Tegillarca granosa TaxID=220873 RepID=A0ABQ9EES3_TEGGR|nr:hypothetical protein KUTeg_021389 [Tegillarca granosa]